MSKKNYKIENREVSKLIPYVNNSRIHGNHQVKQIAASITEFGFTSPLLIDSLNNVIAGHGRLLACELLGIKEVPCVLVSGLTEAQKKALVIADNKIAENSDWDIDKLNIELETLKELDFDFSDLGFDFDDEGLDSGVDIDPIHESNYSDKVDSPLYQMTGEKPEISELYDDKKSLELIKKIRKTNLSDDIKKILINASYRHIVFNYKNIAEFYAHSDIDTQELMEDSALVIIDYNKAIEGGYVELSKGVDELYTSEVNLDHEE